MAEDYIDQQVRLFIEARGVEEANKGMESISKTTIALEKNVDKVNKSFTRFGVKLKRVAIKTMTGGHLRH